MRARVFIVAALAAFLGCATESHRPHLTSAEATRLAERTAHSFDKKLVRYTRSSARYDASEHSWWISYSSKNVRETLNNGFSVLVRDDTRETSIVMP